MNRTKIIYALEEPFTPKTPLQTATLIFDLGGLSFTGSQIKLHIPWNQISEIQGEYSPSTPMLSFVIRIRHSKGAIYFAALQWAISNWFISTARAQTEEILQTIQLKIEEARIKVEQMA